MIKEAKIAAFLHDISSLDRKVGHAKRSYDYAKQYFKKHHFTLIHQDLVLDAMKHHSDGFNTDNLTALVPILADKLDITNQRIAPEDYDVVGLNEIQFINIVQVEMVDQTLHINFIAQPHFNQEGFENFYFAKKVFKAIESFSIKLSLNYLVTLNNQTWNMIKEGILASFYHVIILRI